MTPLHEAAENGNTDVTRVLLEAEASLSAVDNMVIKPSVKLIQSNSAKQRKGSVNFAFIPVLSLIHITFIF